MQWYNGRHGEITNVSQRDIEGRMTMSNSTTQIPVDPDGKLLESGEDSPHPDIEIVGAT
jgi:hypothetical protein